MFKKSLLVVSILATATSTQAWERVTGHVNGAIDNTLKSQQYTGSFASVDGTGSSYSFSKGNTMMTGKAHAAGMNCRVNRATQGSTNASIWSGGSTSGYNRSTGNGVGGSLGWYENKGDSTASLDTEQRGTLRTRGLSANWTEGVDLESKVTSHDGMSFNIGTNDQADGHTHLDTVSNANGKVKVDLTRTSIGDVKNTNTNGYTSNKAWGDNVNGFATSDQGNKAEAWAFGDFKNTATYD